MKWQGFAFEKVMSVSKSAIGMYLFPKSTYILTQYLVKNLKPNLHHIK